MKLPVCAPDKVELTSVYDSTLTEDDEIMQWTIFLFEIAPRFVWDAILGGEGKRALKLRENMRRFVE